MQSNSLDKIREANDKKTQADLSERRHKEKLDTSKSLENVLFESFQSLVSVLEGNSTKAEAISMVVDALDKLDKQTDDNKSELALVKSGLTTLEKQLKEIPSDSLKQIPKFLQQREVIKVTNLSDLDKGFAQVESAIKGMKLTVPAPQVSVEPTKVNVPAPIVNVPPPNLAPLQQAMLDVIKAVKASKLESEGGVVKTRQVNTLINEKFDEYRIVYDTFDEEDEDPKIEAIDYYYKNKKVATLKYTYDKDGHLTGGKRV